MRVVSSALRIAAGLVAGLVLLYVVVNGASLVGGVVERHRVTDEVSAVLPRILPSAERAQGELVAEVGREPERRWIEQACRHDHDDSGWIVVSWREVCVMRSVAAWRVASEQEARALVPTADGDRWTYQGCTPLGAVGPPGVVAGPEATYVDQSASRGEGEVWCVFELGPADDARTLAGERTDLGEGRWLLLVAEQPLVDEDIGCARWSVLFCDNPWTGHPFAEAPAR